MIHNFVGPAHLSLLLFLSTVPSRLQDIAEHEAPDSFIYRDVLQLLAEKGRFSEAFEVMRIMHRTNTDPAELQFGESKVVIIAGQQVFAINLSFWWSVQDFVSVIIVV